MNSEQFVAAIRTHVELSAVDETIGLLVHPPGRKPGRELVDLSLWYRSLAPADREMVSRAMSEAVHAAVFGMCAVLDGVRPITPEPLSGQFELLYQDETGRTQLHGDLHELLNAR